MNQSKHKLIGGQFGLPEYLIGTPSSPDFISGEPVLLFNARSGIKLVVDQLKPGKVWLPSYLCPTMVAAVDKNISSINMYRMNECLSPCSSDFLSEMKPDDLFICIDYFGFPFDEHLIEQVKLRGCKVMRDCSQALFCDFHNDQLCDFHLFSPRKFLGVPDGGVLHAKKKISFQTGHLLPSDEAAFLAMLQAVVLRRDFDLFGENREWFDFFQKGEALFGANASPMSDVTRMLLMCGFDYDFIQTQRRNNYHVLAERLNQVALFPRLPDDVVPLGFPVSVPDRDIVRARLFEKEIFPPIHWDIRNIVPTDFIESHYLFRHIMTLPCDQRYDENDMNYLADCLLRLSS